MALGNLLGNCQSQTAAALIMLIARLIKAVEGMRNILFLNTAAMVNQLQPVACQLQLNFTAFGRKLDAVMQKIISICRKRP